MFLLLLLCPRPVLGWQEGGLNDNTVPSDSSSGQPGKLPVSRSWHRNSQVQSSSLPRLQPGYVPADSTLCPRSAPTGLYLGIAQTTHTHSLAWQEGTLDCRAKNGRDLVQRLSNFRYSRTTLIFFGHVVPHLIYLVVHLKSAYWEHIHLITLKGK